MKHSENQITGIRALGLLVLAVFITGSLLSAQQDSLIYRYRKMAVEYQQQVKISEHKLKGAESMVEVAEADYLPKLDFTGKYRYYGQEIQLAPPAGSVGIPGEQTNNIYSLNLWLRQPVYTGGYLSGTKKVAEANVEALKSVVTLNSQDIMLNADILYWKVIYRKEINHILTQYRDAIGKFLKVIEDRVQEEIVGKNELYQARVRYNDAQYDVIRTEKEYNISLMDFNRLIGIPLESRPEMAETLQVVKWEKPAEDPKEIALKKRPEIQYLEKKIALNEARENVVGSKYNIQANVMGRFKWGSPGPGLQLDPDFNFIIGANVDIPLFYWGMKKKEVFAVRQETEAAKLEMEQTKDKIYLEVESSYLDLQRTQEQLDFAASALKNATQNVSVMLDRYNEGLSSVLEVLDAQLYWQKSYANYVQSKYQLNVAYSRYLRAIGNLEL